MVCVVDWLCGCVHVRLGSAAMATLPSAAAACVIVAVTLLLCDSAQQLVRALHAPIWLRIA